MITGSSVKLDLLFRRVRILVVKRVVNVRTLINHRTVTGLLLNLLIYLVKRGHLLLLGHRQDKCFIPAYIQYIKCLVIVFLVVLRKPRVVIVLGGNSNIY